MKWSVFDRQKHRPVVVDLHLIITSNFFFNLYNFKTFLLEFFILIFQIVKLKMEKMDVLST